MSGKAIRSVLRSVDFVPLRVDAYRAGRDRFGRTLYAPIIEGTMSGTLCKIVPVDLGQFSSPDEAKSDAASWAALI